MDGDDLLDFNFWPSFADSMLAVVIILVVVLVFVAQHGLAGFQTIRKSQTTVVQSVANHYDGKLDTLNISSTQSRYVVWRGGEPELEIRQDVQLQRITFRGNILFAPNDYRLTQRGKRVLRIVGEAIQPQLKKISQVQIEGHTDIYPTEEYQGGNLELGALRAMSVFRFLRDNVGIDPAKHLMSATSYGQYKPVDRSSGQPYNDEKLWEANNSTKERRRNRRIELLLFYGGSTSGKTGAQRAQGEVVD